MEVDSFFSFMQMNLGEKLEFDSLPQVWFIASSTITT